jgi:hypothetical protein
MQSSAIIELNEKDYHYYETQLKDKIRGEL